MAAGTKRRTKKKKKRRADKEVGGNREGRRSKASKQATSSYRNGISIHPWQCQMPRHPRQEMEERAKTPLFRELDWNWRAGRDRERARLQSETPKPKRSRSYPQKMREERRRYPPSFLFLVFCLLLCPTAAGAAVARFFSSPV